MFQVEEVYDIYGTDPLVPEGSEALGFIFLFKWIEERRSRRKLIDNEEHLYVKEEQKVNEIFFAQQVPDTQTNLS